MTKYYAGIGSRKAPENILTRMTGIARFLARHDYVLRSGGARGPDLAFERAIANKEIFRAKDATDDAIELASKYHPVWIKCSEYVKQLHGRNSMILLGADLNKPVDFVVCWTPDGQASGGTGQSIQEIANAFDIPVVNLFNTDWNEWWNKTYPKGASPRRFML